MAATQLTHLDLPWLPRLGADFRARLQTIRDASQSDPQSDWGRPLRALATQALGLNQAIAISQAVAKLQEANRSKSLTTLRLGLVCNGTTDFIKPFLIATAARFGLCLEVIAADFDQGMQEAMNPESTLNLAKPDAVLIAMDYRGFAFRNLDTKGWPPFSSTAALRDLQLMCESFRRNSGAVCLVQSLAAPAESLFGSLDALVPGTLRASIAQFNSELTQYLRSSGDLHIDIDWLAQQVGLDQWYDDRQWHFARLPFAQKALPLYADFVCRSLAAMRGKSRKCLILDLDNTLWGGVIGDDGLDGIALNPGDPLGEAFRVVQQTAADLRRRGIVLAVCSKNDENVARHAFQTHPGMILKEADIAVFSANWDDKATNIERIARQLELGLDALVLLDDNPAEREQVRQALPDVAVPEIGEDPSRFPRLLLSAGYFESVAFTSEDVDRADQYRGNADRARAFEGSRNLDDFLRSLDMSIKFTPFTAAGRKRITQLINKTNQFNVTTKRYTDQQVAALEQSPLHHNLQVAVTDRFGDNGMIGVVICAAQGEEWHIDTWLMSCRVLNRKIEEAVCNQLASAAKAAGAKRLVGIIVPTDRNSIVRNLYERLGFKPADSIDAESQRWTLDLDGFVPFDIVAQVAVEAA